MPAITSTGTQREYTQDPAAQRRYGDTSVMRSRLTSSHLVGRVGELAELEAILRDAGEQRPALVLLGGESGVGKTRLVREFEQRHAEDAIVLRGEAVEQGELSFPMPLC